MDGSGNGYVGLAAFGDGRLYLYRSDAGTWTSLGFRSVSFVATDTIKLGVVGTTFTLYKNDVAQGATFTDATYSSGAPGLSYQFDDSNLTRMDTFIAEGLVAVGPAIDTVDDPITPGSNAHTVSGFSGTVNAGTFTTGTAELSFTTANDTASTIAEPVNGGDAVEYGASGDYELTDGTDSALINTTLEPSTGNAVVTLTSGFDTSSTSWLYLYGGTPAIGDQAYYPSTDLTLNPDGTLSGEAGTYTCYFIDLSDAQPLYEEFDVILGESGGPLLTLPTGTATGATTASGTVTTDTGDGTIYYLASVNASEPSGTIKAGSSQPVTTAGSQNVSVSGLTASTAYYLHYIHTSAGALDSNVVSSAQFTTDAAVPPESTDTRQTTLSISKTRIGL